MSPLFKSEKRSNLDELEQVQVIDNAEGFAPYSAVSGVYLREEIIERLKYVQQILPRDIALDVVGGYRVPAVHEDQFRRVLQSVVKDGLRSARYTDEQTLRACWVRAAHFLVAAPEVTGQTTGGCVDVRLRDRFNRVIDMGTEIYNTASPFAPYYPSHVYDFTPPFQKNRDLLRDAMCRAGFAPNNSKWWQFSHGDREHAVLTGAPAAIYGQRLFEPSSGNVRTYNAMPSHDILSEYLADKKIKFAPL